MQKLYEQIFMELDYLPEFKPLMDSAVCKVCTDGNAVTCLTQNFFFLSDWEIISLIALTVSVMLIAFFYMLAGFFQNQQALAHAKTELYEVMVSIVMFAVLFMMINGMCSFKTGALFPTAGHNPTGIYVPGTTTISWADKTIYYSATNYLMDFADYTLVMMGFQYRIYIFIDYITSMEIVSVPMSMGASMKPTAGLGAVIKPVLNNAFTAETIAVITTQAQVYVLDYGTYGLLKYFLPFALILRSFAPTRRIGGTIIAITCVFLFVYPLLIISTYMIVNDSLHDSLTYIGNAMDVLFGNNSDKIWSSFSFMIQVLFKFMWNPAALLMSALITMPAVAKIFLGGVFFPLFNTLILVHIARSVSKSLGEEIDITNLTRMI